VYSSSSLSAFFFSLTGCRFESGNSFGEEEIEREESNFFLN
jgi:hypothetical protein